MKFFSLAAIAAVAANQIEIEIGNPHEDHDAHDVVVHVEDYPDEMVWEIIGNSATNCVGGPYDEKYGTVQTTCNLAPGRYIIKCKDEAHDGWHGGYLKIGGTKYCEDFTTGHLKVVEFQKHMVPSKASNPAKVTGTNQSGPNN